MGARVAVKLVLVALGTALLGALPGPRELTAALRRAEAFRAATAYGAALDAYGEAAGLAPASSVPRQRQGEVLLRQHRYGAAAEAFQQAARRGGGAAAALGLAAAQAGLGDWAAALGTALHARSLAPGDARVYLFLGRATAEQGQLAAAREFLEEALALSPPPDAAAGAHALLGRLLLDDDPAAARRHLEQAGDADMVAVLAAAGAEPDPARRALLFGIAFLQRGELPLARVHLERAVTLDPGGAEPLAYLGHLLDLVGATGQAEAALERALALDPDLAVTYYFAGAHRRLMGDPEGARAVLWQGLLLDPENAALRLEMAQAALDAHDYPGAEAWYRAAADAAPPAQRLDFSLALVHFYVDHVYALETAGLAAAQAAAGLAPDDARAQDLLGWADTLAGDPVQGEAALLRALALDPTLVSAHYHLGSLYATAGRRDEAREHLVRAADLDTTGYYRERAEALLDTVK